MTVHFLTMGDIHSLTGGYLYNMNIMEGLEQNGYSVNIIGTDWPWDNKPELEKISRFHFEKLVAGSCILIDSLVLSLLRREVQEFSDKLIFVGMIHLPASYSISSDGYGKLSGEELLALHQMRQVIVTGQFTFDLLCNAGLNPAGIRVVEPGTDQFPQKTHYKPVPSELLCIANYSPIKAQDILIRSLNRITDRDWTLHLYGDKDRDKEYSAMVNSLIKEFHLKKRVIMHGIAGRDEITAIFLDADLFVMPSLFESYGMALTESLAHGIPVVTTRTGNIPVTVPAGMGIFVEPGNEQQLADAIRSLLDDPAKYTSLCADASQYHLRARSWEQAVTEFEMIISKTVKSF
jgi:glycosyltransferase involved in cell wall biosynthesis